MRVLIQRVSEASVEVDGKVTGKIGTGLLLFLGIEEADAKEDIDWLVRKIRNMRIFPDDDGKMNRSVQDVKGGFLVISQFTLHASTKKGNRPSFILAASPEKAIPMYDEFIKTLHKESDLPVESGEFGAHMDVSLVNDGPVTIWMDSKSRE